MAPRLGAEPLVHALQRLLGCLLRDEAAPLVEPALHLPPRVLEVPRRLVVPVATPLGHPAPPTLVQQVTAHLGRTHNLSQQVRTFHRTRGSTPTSVCEYPAVDDALVGASDPNRYMPATSGRAASSPRARSRSRSLRRTAQNGYAPQRFGNSARRVRATVAPCQERTPVRHRPRTTLFFGDRAVVGDPSLIQREIWS